jgi:hypothetical protein
MDKFWNPDVWLPPNVTWADLEPTDKIAYADHRHLAIPLPFAFVLLGVRYVLERLVKKFGLVFLYGISFLRFLCY